MHDVIAPVVDASFLAAQPEAVVADVRWYLDGRDGLAAFQQAHLPGAIWVDLETALAAHDLPVSAGRHPFPTPAAFAQAMGALGIGDDTVVVAYDDGGGMTAGRLVTMLRMLGRDAAVLDGGLTAWAADGHPVEAGPATSLTPREFTSAPWPAHRLATADETLAHASSGGAVIDARAAERFTGEVALIDPRPGHIPGARSAPWASVLGPDGRFRSPQELRDHFAALSADQGDTVAYCGSGVSACMNALAMELAGLTPPRLYVASWSGWSSDPDRPAELGADCWTPR
jgi:thiosulfate/3-mercaptopyruvate sulfurtransferase